MIISLVVLLAPLVISQDVCSSVYPEAFCQGIAGNRFISSFRSCQHWVQCINTFVANCGTCTGFLHFDRTNQTCTYPENAACDIYAANITCTPGVVSHEPHPNNCNLFYLCTGSINAEPIQMTCAPGLNFCSDIRKCNLPHLANCAAAPRPPGPVVCPPHVQGVHLIPDPTSCEFFYLCDMKQQANRMPCPANHHFCENRRFCRPIGEAVCTPPAVPMEVFDDKSQFHNCPDSGLHFIPYSGNCGKYVICNDGKATEHNCAPGLHFNPSTQRCEQAGNFPCQY